MMDRDRKQSIFFWERDRLTTMAHLIVLEGSTLVDAVVNSVVREAECNVTGTKILVVVKQKFWGVVRVTISSVEYSSGMTCFDFSPRCYQSNSSRGPR